MLFMCQSPCSRKTPEPCATLFTHGLHAVLQIDQLKGPLSLAGVRRIPRSCGQVCTGAKRRHVHTRVKEHESHCPLLQVDKPAVAEHWQRQAVGQLSNVHKYCLQLPTPPSDLQGSKEIQEHLNNMNVSGPDWAC